MKFMMFEANKPETLVFGLSEALKGPHAGGLLVLTQCGRAVRLAASLAPEFEALNLRPGESFGICRYEVANGVPEWHVWLTPETIKGRTGGRLVVMPRRSASGAGRGSAPIPANVAFSEILAFVRAGAGKDWSDAAVCDMVCSIVKSAHAAGWIGPWERDAA